MQDLTVEDFLSLEPGDLLEADSLFPGLTQEPVVLHTRERVGDSLKFTATLFGVTLADVTCTRTKGALKWTM